MFTIGVALGNISSEHVNRLIEGICSKAKEKDVRTIAFMGTYSRDYSDSEDGESYEIFSDNEAGIIYDYAALTQFDALIINYNMIKHYMSDKAKPMFDSLFHSIPTVFVDEDSPVPEASSVCTANYPAQYALTEHLIKVHGCRNIAVLAGPIGNPDADERLNAIKTCCADNNIKLEDRQIVYGDFSHRVRPQTEQLLAEFPEMDALIGANDLMVYHACNILKEHGKVIGKDIFVTGFDDDPTVLPLADPPLTTAYQNAVRLGELAVEKVLDLANGGAPEKICVPADLRMRSSCGCDDSDMNETYRELRLSAQRYDTLHERAMQVLLFTRAMTDRVRNETAFYKVAAEHLSKFGCKAAYLALNAKPMAHSPGTPWAFRQSLDLTAAIKDGEVTVYTEKNRRRLYFGNGFMELSFDGDGQSLFLIPLYSGNRHHGVLILDTDVNDLYYNFLAALQIESALDYRALSIEMDEKNSWLEAASQTDPLTKALNRRGFENIAEHSIRNNIGKTMRLYFCDMDHLKMINDNFGHNEGDFAILTEYQILRSTFHHSSNIIGRHGGDEFIVLDTNPDTTSDDNKTASISMRCSEFNSVSDKPYYIELSCGCAEFVCDNEITIADLIELADKELYKAKLGRRNTPIK